MFSSVQVDSRHICATSEHLLKETTWKMTPIQCSEWPAVWWRKCVYTVINFKGTMLRIPCYFSHLYDSVLSYRPIGDLFNAIFCIFCFHVTVVVRSERNIRKRKWGEVLLPGFTDMQTSCWGGDWGWVKRVSGWEGWRQRDTSGTSGCKMNKPKVRAI